MRLNVFVFSATLFLSIFNEVSAQPWFTTGNIATGTEFVGTINAQPLNFRTGNVQRMRITPTGLVGLGNL